MGPYIFNDAAKLNAWLNAAPLIALADAVIPDSDKGFGVQCVGLVKFYSRAGATPTWTMGDLVLTSKDLAMGTAIATFDPKTKRYPNHAYGNHACFFLAHVDNGIKVLEQHVKPNSTSIQTRVILSRGEDAAKYSVSDNADAYSVIL